MKFCYNCKYFFFYILFDTSSFVNSIYWSHMIGPEEKLGRSPTAYGLEGTFSRHRPFLSTSKSRAHSFRSSPLPLKVSFNSLSFFAQISVLCTLLMLIVAFSFQYWFPDPYNALTSPNLFSSTSRWNFLFRS